ncbi:GATS protein-like 3 [Mortierella polycephala]|uniref:GATS protein-like 3 n=1 Tax=Mortierella polycephala TaxID=41804 RepID=A0A9P6TVZ9_9FUNG|nr:GATS protein-like 3 [Mortierella polycephala]
MIVDILPFRLRLASIGKSDIPRCTHQLMKLVLFPAGPQHFFSYTETDTEVSLILDESHVPGFPEDALNICNVIWRAVQIEPGESGLGAVEVVSLVSKSLVDINVPIMQISTYDADFTMVPECDLEKAMESLQKKFSVSNDPIDDADIQPEELQSWDETYPMTPTEIHSLHDALTHNSTTRRRKPSLISMLRDEDSPGPGGHRHSNGREDSGIGSEVTSGPSSGTASGHGSHVLDTTLHDLDPSLISSLSLEPNGKASNSRYPFRAIFPHRLHITSLEQGLVDQLAIKLLESIFFDNRQVLATNTTLSIIMDDATMSLFPDNTLNTQAGDWRLIAIGDGPLGDKCGIMSAFSRPLNENGIGLFYLSTFNSDYIMVNDQDFEQTVDYLEKTARTVFKDEPSSPTRDTQDAKSICSIDTASHSGVSSDLDASELSPVSTATDALEDKDEAEAAPVEGIAA